MGNDEKHARRLRHAMAKLLMARKYQAISARLVREAERELEAAIDEAAPKKEAA